MRLRLFGRLRDAVMECDDLTLPAHVGDAEALRAWLGEAHPLLLDPTVRIALDDRIVSGAVPIDGAREVAFLPPVSGG